MAFTLFGLDQLSAAVLFPPLAFSVIVDELGGVDDELPPPVPEPLAMEHSFTDLEGIGSDPKVAMEQENDPLNIL